MLQGRSEHETWCSLQHERSREIFLFLLEGSESGPFGHWFGEVKISPLLFLNVIWGNVLGWSGIVLGGFKVLKLEKGFFDIVFHGELDCTFCVVPVEVDSYVLVAFPVRLHRAVISDGFFKV